ncbi:Hypothetical predicted protein, partial [Paramuricea clavata]
MATRRATRTQEEENPDIKDILTCISKKLDNIGESLQQIVDHQHKEERNTSECFEQFNRSMSTISNEIGNALDKTNHINMENQVKNQRQKISRIWNNHLNKRKQLYWHSLNSENTALIYETWINKEKKILPRKFLIKSIANEDINETRIRQNSAVENFRNELALLNVRAERHKSKCKQTEEEMKKFLEDRFTGHTLTELKNLWHEDVTHEESKSLKKWESKQIWLEKYEAEFKHESFLKPPRKYNESKPTGDSRQQDRR